MLDEARRLNRLHEYRVLDTEAEEALDDLTGLAAQICGTPMAAVSLVDADRQWFKARVGIEALGTAREVSFCAYALQQTDLVVVPDATRDERFASNPLVTGEPGIRYYAAAPLVTPDGAVLGTLCVIDRVPRELTPLQLHALQVLARQVMTHLELRREVEERKENGRLLQTIFDSDPDCLKLLSANGRVQMINAAGLRMIEADTVEAGEVSFFDLVAEESQEAFMALTARVFAGEVGLLEHELIGLKGTRRSLEVHAAPLRNESGEVTAVLGITRDITERRRAEESVRASELRYRTLFEQALDGILVADAKGRCLEANPAACRMLGYERGELLGLSAVDITPEAVHGRVAATIEALKGRTEFHGAWQFKRKDGSIFPVEVSATMTPDGNLLSVVRDTTVRVRAESRLRRLVDSNAQGVIFWNKQGKIVEANDAFLNLVGYSRDDLERGLIPWATMTAPGYDECDHQCLAQLTAKGVCVPYEKELIRKDGSLVPILIGTAAFEDDAEEGVSFVLDVSARKKLEQQFLRAQRMESIGTLAGGIAHDLNNSLGPIMTAIELLRMEVKPGRSQEMLEIIGTSARRAADMVRQVLSFASGMGGRRIEVQLRHLIHEIEKIVRDTFLKHIHARTSIAPHLRTVLGDPTQLHQVLLNLCVNARDAMPNGGTLVISAENIELDAHYVAMNPEARTGSYVVLKVKDSGTGIPAGVLDRMFEPFFTTKELTKGTGLGLSTSLGIVNGHGGFILVESQPSKGTTFEVYLPAALETSSVVTEEPAELPRGHGELILVVDDEAHIREISRRTLQEFGYQVIEAADGTQAVSALAVQGAKIAAVLTDITMPVMDGNATIRALRTMSPTLPIAATSGLPEDAQLSGLGVSLFLQKPYSAEELLKVIAALVAKP